MLPPLFYFGINIRKGMSSSEISGTATTATHWFLGMAAALIEVVAASPAACSCASGHAVAFAAEHAEIIDYNFGGVFFLTFFVLPLAGLKPAVNENQRPFFQVLLRDFGLLTPDDNLVPFGLFLALTTLIFVTGIGGQGKMATA